ncbi:P-loop containing nucleoside triphosphate hydrolase protein [Diplogelasinospora grovesii]|uniref:Kinesin-like protein n=1 Tax=Diplogelasinospora grovesii TaxID=303347 RepID=A0AAN6N904_9PEZI|nr:P-loop containing nucleoside triphosphate hydrolase protein [Diplogelasinospora grovesii]
MMDASENVGVLPSTSRLRPPQVSFAIPRNAAISGLQEMNDLQTNARATGQMGPPLGIPQKRALNGNATQSEPKRKTLSERAGEPIQKTHIPSFSMPPASSRSTVQGASITSLTSASNIGAPRPTSTTTSTVPRSTTMNNFGRSVGPAGRPPMTSMSRQPNSINFSQSVNGRPRAMSRPRPGTSAGNYGPEIDATPNHQQNDWDVNERIQDLDSQFRVIKEAMDSSISEKQAMEKAVDLANSRVGDLERERDRLDSKNVQLQSELDTLRQQRQSLALEMEKEQLSRKYELEDKTRAHRSELDQLRREFNNETDRQQRTHREALEAMERHYRAELEEERAARAKEVDDLRSKLGAEQQGLNEALLEREDEIQKMRSQMEALKLDLEREQTIQTDFKKQMAHMSTTNLALEDRNRALRAQIDFLESDNKQQSDAFANMEARLQEALRIAEEARQKLIKEETERRVIFNKYQELKGNIRVMCRVRPVLDSSEGGEAKIAFPDHKTSTQIDLTGPEEKSSLGAVVRRTIPFEFDRVFSPAVHNEEVFGEISQLVQSALDGYNVCIFCYGQTGSGKTYTMSSADGMIPRATHMIYDTINQLKNKSWTYTMEGSFVEVYNEELNDLLTSGDSKKKLEIRHDDQRKQTTVLNCKRVELDSADKVELMLREAQNNRSVAATKANERSSRSHSVFMLKLVGENSATNERCEGTLNLVDLAGSERLKHSQAEGDRMKETQNINKSLACLGDVIEALGRGSSHIPYRNSKLTHLLQYSLGGNSKTLMFVMVSPLEAHLKETITSLRFATKVHNTHIGTAKSTKKTREGRASE